nr:MAG TPA: hypothetical protein [Caudoviricetes sp.]
MDQEKRASDRSLFAPAQLPGKGVTHDKDRGYQ